MQWWQDSRLGEKIENIQKNEKYEQKKGKAKIKKVKSYYGCYYKVKTLCFNSTFYCQEQTDQERERTEKIETEKRREMRKMAGNRKGHYKCQMEGNQQTRRQKRQQKKTNSNQKLLFWKEIFIDKSNITIQNTPPPHEKKNKLYKLCQKLLKTT